MTDYNETSKDRIRQLENEVKTFEGLHKGAVEIGQAWKKKAEKLDAENEVMAQALVDWEQGGDGGMKIQTIPMEELVADRQASLDDIKVCETALSIGIIRYSGGAVRERKEVNERIVERIDREILRRGKP